MVESRIAMDDLEAVADAAVVGAGLAWLPCWLIAARLHAGKLLAVLEDKQRSGREIYAVWQQTRH